MKNSVIFLFFVLIGILIIVTYNKLYLKLNNGKTIQKLKNPVMESRFSLENAPSESLHGIISSQSGTIQWQSRIATTPAELPPNTQIQQGEIIDTLDNSKLALQFSNVCLLQLSPNTELNFIQTLPSNFVIEQKKGTTAYFLSNTNSISIRSLHLLVKVNTGNLVVSVDPNKDIITVNVIKGSVTIGYIDLKDNSNVLGIKDGNQYVFRDITRKGSIIPISIL